MYSMKQIREELRAEISRQMEVRNDEIEPAWVAQAVLVAHSEIDGDDKDFYLCAARQAIQHEARQIVNALDKGDVIGPEQLVMEGFNYLQRYYVVERDGRRPAIAIDQCSREELEAKEREHFTRSETEAEHAREIRRYIEIRFGAHDVA